MTMAPDDDPTPEIGLSSTVIRAWAPWCGSCRSMAPLVDRVAASSGIEVIDVRVDEEPDLVDRYRVRSVPTLIGLRGGTEVGRLVGLQSIDAIKGLFSATSAAGGPIVARAPRSLVVTRAAAGIVVVGFGSILSALPLIVVGAALIAWALLGLARG